MAEQVQWFRPGVPLRPQRVNLSVTARYRLVGEDRWHPGRSENISQAGVLIRGARLFSQKAKVEVLMALPPGIVMNAAGETLFVGTVARLLPPPHSGSL